MVYYVASKLEIREVEINFREHTRKAGKADAAAYVKLNPAYARAQLTFAGDFDTPRELFGTVVHELVHVKMMPLAGFWDMLRPTLPGTTKKLAKEAYRQADEQVTVGFERVLSELLWEGYCDEYELDEDGMDQPGGISEEEGVHALN